MSKLYIPRDINCLTIDLTEHNREIRNKTIEECMKEVAKAMCVGCGYLNDTRCVYKGNNCMVSKPMLEVVTKTLGDMKERNE